MKFKKYINEVMLYTDKIILIQKDDYYTELIMDMMGNL